MYKVNIKKYYILGFLYLLLCLISLYCIFVIGFLIYNIFFYYDAKSLATEVEFNTYSETKQKDKAIYYYNVKDKTYTCEIDMSESEEEIIDDVRNHRVKVLYHSKNPENCGLEVSDEGEMESFTFIILIIFLPLILLIIFVFLIPFILFIKTIRILIKIHRLKKNGTLIKFYPSFVEHKIVFFGLKQSIFDRPYIEYEGRRLFGHRRFSYFSTPFPENYVDLLIDVKNPKIYYMDYKIDRLEGNRSEDYYEGIIIKEDE